jgi:hypothetical protein
VLWAVPSFGYREPMTPETRFPPMFVIVPSRIGGHDALVSRPLLGPRGAGSASVPWIAVAIGARGDDWVLARRPGSFEELTGLLGQASDSLARLGYVWTKEDLRGPFRKAPPVLRAHGAQIPWHPSCARTGRRYPGCRCGSRRISRSWRSSISRRW